MRHGMMTLLTSVLVLVCSEMRSEEIVDKKFGFRFTVPEGFELSIEPKNDPNTLYAFFERDAAPDNLAIVIQISRLRGTIRPDTRHAPEDFPTLGGIAPSVQTKRWHDVMIDTIRLGAENGNDTSVTYGAQFPLPDEAVQIIVAGPKERDTLTQAIFDQSFASFTKLRRPDSPGRLVSRELTEAEGREGVLRAGLVVIVIVCIVVYLQKRSRRRKKKAGK